MFAIAAVLTSVGAVSPGAVAIIAPIALGFAAQYKISPLLMGLLVIHGAQAGGFSPISIYGGITNGVVAKAGLPLNELATMMASFTVNLGVSVLLFFVLGGRDLLQRRAVLMGPAPRVPHVEIAGPQTGIQAYGDAESEALTEEIALETGQKVAAAPPPNLGGTSVTGCVPGLERNLLGQRLGYSASPSTWMPVCGPAVSTSGTRGAGPMSTARRWSRSQQPRTKNGKRGGGLTVKLAIMVARGEGKSWPWRQRRW